MDPLPHITGVDVGYDVKNGLAKASLITLTFPDLKPIEEVQTIIPVNFPYIPGLLSFREIPAILAAIAELKTPPALFMVDGQGIAHPRRMGIAAHIGVLLDMPSIGVAKSKLAGTFEMPANSKGATTPLWDKGEQIGTVLRSKANVAPLFISPGHRVSHTTAVKLVIDCIGKFRLPEPTRLADKRSKYK